MTTHAINARLYRRLRYDSVRDFTPITLIAAGPLFELVLYTGILAPRGLSTPTVDRLNAEFGRAVQAVDVQKIYRKVGAVPISSTPAEFAAHISAEMRKLGKLVQRSGARVDERLRSRPTAPDYPKMPVTSISTAGRLSGEATAPGRSSVARE